MHISGDIGFQLLTLPVTYYGLFILLGVAAGVALAFVQTRVHGERFDDAVLLACTCALCAIVGAKLLYIVVSLPHIDFARLSEPAYLLELVRGGFVFYGGLAGALLGVPLSKKLFGIGAYRLANILAPCLALGHGIGRLGCLAVGCCYGMPYDGPFAVVYDHSIAAPNGVPLLPIQLIEALCEFALAALLLLYVNKLRGTHGIAAYLVSYAIVRFVLEFFRFDDIERGMELGLSTSQWIGIAIVVSVAVWALVSRMGGGTRGPRS